MTHEQDMNALVGKRVRLTDSHPHAGCVGTIDRIESTLVGARPVVRLDAPHGGTQECFITDRRDATLEETIVRITEGNAGKRIRDAIHVIRSSWDEWEAQAGDDAQREQNQDAYDRFMDAQLSAVIEGVVFDI